jgi:hypothetical protein
VARWDCGAKLGQSPSAADPVCHAVGAQLERGVRPHCAGAPAALWHKGPSDRRFLAARKRGEGETQGSASHLAAAALPEYTADCWVAATPKTRKKRCWKWCLGATRNAPSAGALLSKLPCEYRSVLPRFRGSRDDVSERHPTDLAS